MQADQSEPCPHCRVLISPEASVCPHCRSGVLVDLRLVDPIGDGRMRYRVGRALVGLGGGVPPFTVLQAGLTVRGGVVLGGVSRALAQRAQSVFEAERVPVRIENARGRAVAPTRSASHRTLKIGVAAGVLLAALGGWYAFSHLTSGPGVANDSTGDPELSPAKVAELGLPATVALRCENRLGSGFFIDRDRLITNAHVLCPGSSTIKVRFSDGREVEGTVERSEEALDLAIVRATGLQGEPLRPGDAGALKVGERLTLIGSPVGMEFTVHQGNVSNVDRREFGVAYIQVAAPVNPGNSGGPLINDRGRVVGVITLKRADAEGIGLAVPINYLHTGSSPLVAGLAGPRSPGFERMAQRAEAESLEMAGDLARNGQLPALVAANPAGPVMLVRVLWPSSADPGAHTFTFNVWNGRDRVCSFEGEVPSWSKLAAKGGGSPLPPRIKGWLARNEISMDLYVGEIHAPWDQCPADQLDGEGPIELEMEGADPSAMRAQLS